MTKKQFFILGVPVVIANFFEPLVTLTDAAIIGSLPENALSALAAISFGGSIINSLFWLLGNMKSASIATFSPFVGVNNSNKLQDLIGHLIIFSFLMGITISLLAFLGHPILAYYGLEQEVLDIVYAYGLIRLFGMPFSLGILILFGVLYSLEKSALCMRFIIFAGALNIIVSYVLVHVFSSYDDIIFSAQKIAFGTLLSEFLVFFLAFFIVKKNIVNIRFLGKIDWETTKSFVVQILHLMVRSIAIIFVFQSMNFMAAKLGSVEVSIQSIMMNLFLFTAFVLDGFSAGVLMTAGRLQAQMKFEKLKSVYYNVQSVVKYSGFGLIIISLLGYYFIPFLFSNHLEFHNGFYAIFWILIISFPIGSWTYCFDSLFKSIGKMKDLKNISMLSSFIIYPIVFGSLYLFFGLSILIIWISFFCWLLGRFIFGRIKFNQYIKTIEVYLK